MCRDGMVAMMDVECGLGTSREIFDEADSEFVESDSIISELIGTTRVMAGLSVLMMVDLELP